MHRRFFIAAGTALAATPMVATPLRADEPLRMRDLYTKMLDFSDKARALEGQRIEITGFMAPPLKADSQFFVLTKRPMAVCPFCESEAEWPSDILAIYTKRRLEVVPFNSRIVVRGELSLGGYTDPETGFVSRVRLNDASYDRA